MAIGISVAKDIEGLSVDLTITGLTVGTRYDVMRLQQRFVGTDADTGTPLYERELPDRAELWSSVAHRVAWVAPTATVTIRDYETPMRPTSWFVVPTDSIGPYEHDWLTGNYDLTRGVLSSSVVHFQRDLEQLAMEPGPGHIIVRAVHDLGSYTTCCVVDIPELKYTARGSELSVIGRSFPVYVGDVREARRGSVTFKVDSLGQYDRLRSIMFPANGKIWPVVFNAASGDPTLLLDDLRLIPLDLSVEQISHNNADLRYVHVDFVEIGGAPTPQRTGDNDTLVTAPLANFTRSDTTPSRNQTVTVTSTSTGQFSNFEWTFTPKPSNLTLGVSYTQGPHRLKYASRGQKTIKLRVYGPAGAHSATKTVQVD